MKRPAVTILTPIKATRPAHIAWLDEAIQSVANQSYGNWAMHIVDDASPLHDELVALAEKWQAKRNVFWLAGQEPGTSACRNLAAREAISELLLPLDADDKLASVAVERFLEAWEERGDAGIIYSDVVMFGQDWAQVKLAPSYDFNRLLMSLFMFVGCLHRKVDWERVGGWRVDMELGLEDWEYWIALGELNVCGKRVKEPLYWYRRQTRGRLERLKADPQQYNLAYQRMRDLHVDAFNGRLDVCNCGGRVARLEGHTNVAPVLQMRGDREPIVYMGRRTDEFWVAGAATRQKYRVPGRAEFLIAADGTPGVDPRDAAAFLKLNGGAAFRRIARPHVLEQAVVQEEARAAGEAWEPSIMEATDAG